jgi:hypothetical protein
MTPERPSPGRPAERRREALLEIREELERIRRSEARVAEALGSMRAARQRVEELASAFKLEEDSLRDIVRQELLAVDPRAVPPGSRETEPDVLGVSGLFGAAAAVDAEETSPRADDPAGVEPAAAEAHRSLWLVGVAALSVFVVAAVAWLAVQAFRGDAEPPMLTVGGADTAPPVLQAPPADENEIGIADVGDAGAAPATGAAERSADRFFTLLPSSATARAAVYDSLWSARSPMFDPLFERVESATRETTVRRALAAWRAGSATPLQRDLLHSALVQYALREEMGAELSVDGQLLRNPCRGASCSALLNFWETRRDDYALPPIPEDAPRNTQALRVAENVLVLRTLEQLHLGRMSRED